MERETRFELATATLEGWSSTIELLPLNTLEENSFKSVKKWYGIGVIPVKRMTLEKSKSWIISNEEDTEWVRAAP